ncbi:hypothetical protein QYM36_009538, partial [Artemia franciscana]
MGPKGASLVLTENVGPVLTIGINRPEVRNCVNNDTAKQLIHAFEEAEKDDAVKSIVLHGFGGSLCSGYDLSQLKDMDGEADIPQDYGPMGPTRMEITKPTVAAVSGYAVAGGLELALMCDLRVMEETAVMGVFCRRFGTTCGLEQDHPNQSIRRREGKTELFLKIAGLYKDTDEDYLGKIQLSKDPPDPAIHYWRTSYQISKINPDFQKNYPALKRNHPDQSNSTNGIRIAEENINKSTVQTIMETLEEISIPGFKTIFGDRAKLPRRIMWIAVLLICALTSGFQVQDRVFYYLSFPVDVSVRVTRNSTLRFPTITICNKNEFNMSKVMSLRKEMYNLKNEAPILGIPGVDWNISELVGFKRMNAKQLWNEISHDINVMALECWFGRNISCSERGKWKKIYTYQGVCYSYKLHDPSVRLSGMFNNFYLKLEEKEKSLYNLDDGWKLLVHDSRDSALIGIRTHGSTVYRGWGKDMRIYVRSFKTLNTKSRPCILKEDYSWSECVAKCFVVALAAKAPCKLPYMDGKLTSFSGTRALFHTRLWSSEEFDVTSASASDYSTFAEFMCVYASSTKCQLLFLKIVTALGVPGDYCSSPESYSKAALAADNLLFFGEWSSSNCSCARQCNQDYFLPYTETSVIENKLGRLRVFFQDLTFDDIKESIYYTSIPLLCDIGGSLGLLLGASVLTFFEIVEAISVAFFVSGKSVTDKIKQK